MLEGYLQIILLKAPPILLALAAHECAHAWVADRLGDRTASMLGRVTMNPFKHLDPVGTLAFFLTGIFGWAKPVPVNPRNFKDPGKALMYVSLAGPATNLVLAAAFAFILKAMLLTGFFQWGLASGAASGIAEPISLMVLYSIQLNVALAIFNLIPIPPLDGSKILTNLLPPHMAMSYYKLEPYGFMVLLVLMYTGVIGMLVVPVISLMVGFLIGGGM